MPTFVDEVLIERYSANNPQSMLCGYDEVVLSSQAHASVAAVHAASLAPGHVVPFNVYAVSDAIGVRGHVDRFSAAQMVRILELSVTDEPQQTIDLSRLEFVDHAGVVALGVHAERLTQQGMKVKFRGNSEPVGRLAKLLGVGL